MKVFKIKLPLYDKEFPERLSPGDIVYISGKVYIMRDRAHKRYIEEKNQSLDMRGSCIFYAGPTESGVIGPTTSARMDKFTEHFSDLGVMVFIGKGNRDNAMLERIYSRNRSFYLCTYGGISGYLTEKIRDLKPVLYHDLGCEAVFSAELVNFPCIYKPLKQNHY